SQHLACERCGRSYETLNPHHFSFNSPLGWCPTCEGLGVQQGANINLLIRDASLSLRGGAIAAWPPLDGSNAFLMFAEALAAHVGFSLDTSYRDLTPTQQRALLYGTGDDWIAVNAERGAQSAERKTKPTRRGREDSDSSAFRVPRSAFQYKGLFP